MAQYLAITGSSFGNGHNDNPIYTITADAGTVYRSGSATGTQPAGGYVFTPATASKAELTTGIKVKVDNSATEVTATVNGGYQCAGTTAVQSWTIDPTPTATPTGTPTQTPTPSAQIRTLAIDDVEPDSTIDGGAGLTIASAQINYTQDDVNAGNQGLIGPILISYAAGEDFTVHTVDLDDGLGNSYTYTLSDYVGGAGRYLSVTGSYPDTAGGSTTTIDVTISASSVATYEHELRWIRDAVDNSTFDFDLVQPSTANLTETANTQSFTGQDGAYYTASFVFSANNDYVFENANDITVSLSDGTPSTGISKIRQALSGANNEYVEIWYAGTIGANNAFADLTFSGTPVFTSSLDNARDTIVKYRVPGGSGTFYELISASIITGQPATEVAYGGGTLDLRVEGHNGRYSITNNLGTSWITSISPQDNDSLDTITHTVTLASNPGSARITTIQLGPQGGDLGEKLNIPISQSSNA